MLRDGTTAAIRVGRCQDQAALRAFFEGLSPEARRHRFFSASLPPAKLVDALCDSADPRRRLTLVVTRAEEGSEQIIATASYDAIGQEAAEVAFAVADGFHGKGLGTLLLERLAVSGSPSRVSAVLGHHACGQPAHDRCLS